MGRLAGPAQWREETTSPGGGVTSPVDHRRGPPGPFARPRAAAPYPTGSAALLDADWHKAHSSAGMGFNRHGTSAWRASSEIAGQTHFVAFIG